MNATSEKTNWINKVKTIQASNRERIITMLGLTEMEYFDILLDAGAYYLTDVIQVGVWRDEFLSSGVFWAWWRNHWQKWDALFLEHAKATPKTQWHELYDNIHDTYSTQFRPHNAVLEDIFHKEVVEVLTQNPNKKCTP